MNMVMPTVTSATTTYLCRANARRYQSTFITMTGTSLQDLARTIAGYEMWESEAKPNGAAKVMKKEHWMYLSRSDLLIECLGGEDMWPFDSRCPLVAPFAVPFDLALVCTTEGERPRTS